MNVPANPTAASKNGLLPREGKTSLTLCRLAVHAEAAPLGPMFGKAGPRWYASAGRASPQQQVPKTSAASNASHTLSRKRAGMYASKAPSCVMGNTIQRKYLAPNQPARLERTVAVRR